MSLEIWGEEQRDAFISRLSRCACFKGSYLVKHPSILKDHPSLLSLLKMLFQLDFCHCKKLCLTN